MSRTRVVNIKGVDFDASNPDHVYIGRANKNYEVAESKWANPFKIDDDNTRDEVIRAYREWIKHQPELLNSLEELRGKILFCWCCPEACHGDVLVEMLEGNTELKIHPAAELFPPMTEAEFLGLKQDIREHGQREHIVVWQGQLIDGRHRLRACRELDIEPQVAELMDETDPWQYVVSHNLHRRHLTTAQRSMVAEKLASLKRGEKKADTGIPVSPPSQAEAAAMVNVSVDSVQQARKIRKTATPETVAAVERGELSLNAAMATIKPAATEKPVVSKAINETRLWYVNGEPAQLPATAKPVVSWPSTPPKAATKDSRAIEALRKADQTLQSLMGYEIEFGKDLRWLPSAMKTSSGVDTVVAIVTRLQEISAVAKQLSDALNQHTSQSST